MSHQEIVRERIQQFRDLQKHMVDAVEDLTFELFCDLSGRQIEDPQSVLQWYAYTALAAAMPRIADDTIEDIATIAQAMAAGYAAARSDG